MYVPDGYREDSFSGFLRCYKKESDLVALT
jgi:hypothetical protein